MPHDVIILSLSVLVESHTPPTLKGKERMITLDTVWINAMSFKTQ